MRFRSRLVESKADQEAFINKFGKEAFDFFKKYSQRLLNANISNDIVWHTKNTSKEEMDKIIHDLENKVIKDKETGKIKLNREYLGSENGYEVYQPLDWETSMNMGEGTKWCITGRYKTLEVKPSQAKQFFNDYTERGIKFYFFIRKNQAEYCVALYPKLLKVNATLSINFELWNKADKNVSKKYQKFNLPYNLVPNLKAEAAQHIDKLYIRNNEVVSADKDITEVVIPDSVTSIGYEAFYECDSLKSITIPDSVTSIGDHAFFGCSSLTSITIPDSVMSIESSAFWGCSSLTSINLPDSVTNIGGHAFYWCDSLKSITIPAGVTSIGISAFQYCNELTNITIPDSVTSIGDYAFSGCRGLTGITFQGTKEQWNAITKGANWDKDTGSYVVHCKDGNISKGMKENFTMRFKTRLTEE